MINIFHTYTSSAKFAENSIHENLKKNLWVVESLVFTTNEQFNINIHYTLQINIRTLNKHIVNQRNEASLPNGEIVLDWLL